MGDDNPPCSWLYLPCTAIDISLAWRDQQSMVRGHEMSLSRSNPHAVYEIRVQGELDLGWENWVTGLAVALVYDSEHGASTSFIGPVEDQAALRGILCNLWDLNLTLLSVRRISARGKKGEDNDWTKQFQS